MIPRAMALGEDMRYACIHLYIYIHMHMHTVRTYIHNIDTFYVYRLIRIYNK